MRDCCTELERQSASSSVGVLVGTCSLSTLVWPPSGVAVEPARNSSPIFLEIFVATRVVAFSLLSDKPYRSAWALLLSYRCVEIATFGS